MISILSLIGIIDTAILTAQHFFTTPLPCSLTNGCETVLTSKFSTIGPVPLALLGLIYYLTIFWLSIQKSKQKSTVLLILTFFGFLFSFYLIYLQLYVINAICQYCLLSGAISTLLFLFSSKQFFSSKYQD